MKIIIKPIFALILTITLLVGFTTTSQAQAFDKGQISLHAGLNLGDFGFYGGGTGLPLYFAADYGVHQYGSAGVYVGYASYGYGFTGSRYNRTFINVGVRGDFHFAGFLEDILDIDLKSDKVDFYVGAMAGFRSSTYKSSDGIIAPSTFRNRPTGGVLIGARYYFAKILGVYAEVGRVNYGALNVGLTLKI